MTPSLISLMFISASKKTFSIIPVTAPVSLCEQFSCKHVCIYLKRGKEAEPSTTRTVLMEASRERVLPDLIHALCELKHVEDSRLYICGASLIPEGAMLAELVVVRQAIVCRSPIESQYHNSVLVSFPLVCYYCGAVEECLMDDEETRQLKQSIPSVFCVKVMVKTLLQNTLQCDKKVTIILCALYLNDFYALFFPCLPGIIFLPGNLRKIIILVWPS